MMEKLEQAPTDHPATANEQAKPCCGGKAGAGKTLQDATETPAVIESAPAPAKDSSGCCGGHR